MNVHVQFTAQLRAAIGRGQDTIDVPEGSTLAALLATLAAASSCAAPHLIAADGPRPSLLVMVNGEAVHARDAAARILRVNDEIVLLPPISGG